MSDSKPLTLDSLLRSVTEALRNVSQSPRLDAEILVREALGLSREQLVMRSSEGLSDPQIYSVNQLLERRRVGEPVAYILGRREFWSLEFLVSSAVLIPRPETEILVEQALKFLVNRKDPVIADLGTGSGCIALSIASELKRQGTSARILASDISASALAVARQNASRLGLEGAVEFRQGPWLAPFSDLLGRIDLIISNPPYIAEEDAAVSPECSFEPEQALYSGHSGTDALNEILEQSGHYLSPQGAVLLEFGQGQDTFIAQHGAVAKVSFFTDLAGITRAGLVTIRR